LRDGDRDPFSLTNTAAAAFAITTWNQHDESVKGTFSGTGGTPGSTVTVSICTTNDFSTCTPVSTATATVASDGTWSTDGKLSTMLDKQTNYFARAV
jgi:hypothetical protein